MNPYCLKQHHLWIPSVGLGGPASTKKGSHDLNYWCAVIDVLLGDGQLQIEELVNNWYALCQHSVNGDELLEAFNTLDVDHDGYIRLDELAVSI